MMKNKCILIYFVVLIFTAAPHYVGAVPALQLYIPDGVYGESIKINGITTCQSWLTKDDPFTLVVAGTAQPTGVDVIKDVNLWIAIQEKDYLDNPDGKVIVKAGNSILAPAGPARFGRPDPLSPHGIYTPRAWYFQYSLPDLMVATAGETVYNYNEQFAHHHPAEATVGDLQFYTITYTDFFWLHLDLSGTALNLDAKKPKSWAIAAPYSHDADALGSSNPIPEPSSFIFLGFGLLGLIGIIGIKGNLGFFRN